MSPSPARASATSRRPPQYDGSGRLRLSTDYLAAPPGDERWADADSLAALEGLAAGFHEYLGLDHTDFSEGLAALVARDRAAGLWAGLRSAEVNAVILGFQAREAATLDFWRANGRPPEGMSDRAFQRQRQIALWRALLPARSAETWQALFADLNARGRPLTQVSDPRAADRLLLQSLRRLTGRDPAPVLKDFGYEP